MRANRTFYLLIALVILILGAFAIYRAAWDSQQRTDYTVYVAAGQALLDHRDIYLAQSIRGWRYVYPPPFAILLVPLARIPLTLGASIWYLLSVASIGASAIMSAALLGPTPLKAKPYLIYGLPLLSLFTLLISGTLRCQASPFMFFFMIAAFYFHLKNHPIAAGFSLACAVLLKVFPIVLIIYFILRRDWRAVIATFGILILFGIILPSLYWGWQFNFHQFAGWFDVVGHPAMMQNTDRAHVTSLYEQLLNTTKPRNQSLESLFLSFGMPARFTRYAVVASGGLMLAIMGISARRIQSSEMDKEQPSMAQNLLCSAFIIWSLLISPIAETHYFGALILPLTLLVGCVEQSRQTRRSKNYCLIIGCAIMALVMITLPIDAIALWRPLCIASILMWLLCICLIWHFKHAKPGFL
ncbi:MAG: DUF2029 domain-containing protein [Burkholderiaceae bacterium]|jgi:hypothetical protein|nr:DUF2029 domain-containing protein [Burkholderiaceae bacterium]